MKWVTVLKVGGEGGSITLLGQDNGNYFWKYKLTTDETALSYLLSEEDAVGVDFSYKSPVAEEWDSIIQLLCERYPYWMNMHPLECHPLFRERIWKLLSAGNRVSKIRITKRWMDVLQMESVMKVDEKLEKARKRFKKEGFDLLPTIPAVLAKQIKHREKWLFSTREIYKSPNFSSFYVDEVSNNEVGDYALLSYSRNGANWMAIHYFLVFGPLRMFLELGRGGMYTDNEGGAIQAANIRECFLLADKIVTATMARCKADDRLTIFCSDFHCSYWVAPGQDTQNYGRHFRGPKDVLCEVLQWLESSEEDGENFMEYALKLAEEMDGEEREEFLAMAEMIDREEDEFEQRKILNLCDYRKRLGKK